MPAPLLRCPHADLIDYPVNCFITEDNGSVELCHECTADLLALLLESQVFPHVAGDLKRLLASEEEGK